MTYNFSELYFYSDSTTALHWIHQQSSRWKVFVANRVSEIQQLTIKGNCYHVASHDNPADILSRGCLPRLLHGHQQWWHGPYWLLKKPSDWPIRPFDSNSSYAHPDLDKEERKQALLALATTSFSSNYVEDYSSLSRLLRVFAYCLRFIRNAKSPVSNRNTSFLTAQELHSALLVFIRQAQFSHFNIEIKELQAHRPVPTNSKTFSLNPFIDNAGILRVGGRLQQSQLNYINKHQIILHPS